MPGSISDNYDPEFGTGDNVDKVAESIGSVTQIITNLLGPDLKNILDVVNGPDGVIHHVELSERQLRIIRFCLNRSKETI